MTLLGFCENDEYRPEYGTLVLRDVNRSDRGPGPDNELLGENATPALAGTVATAGDGWVHATADDHYQTVRWELHDEPPEVRLGEWEDVVETPFHSRTAVVGLTSVTGGSFGDELELGAKGPFRTRVSRKPSDDGDVWLIVFWPAAGDPEPPRWLKRTRPAVRRPDPGWRQVLGYGVVEVSWLFTFAGMKRPEGWLDEPWSGPGPSDDVCDQLGVDPPHTRREAIPLLVAAGLLVDEGAGGLSAGTPRPVTEVLDLPEELRARLEAAAVRGAYVWLAADVSSIAAWSNPAHVEDLAELLAVAGETIAPLLDFAVSDKLVQRDGDVLTALPRPPLHTRYPRSARGEAAARRGARSRVAEAARAQAARPSEVGGVRGEPGTATSAEPGRSVAARSTAAGRPRLVARATTVRSVFGLGDQPEGPATVAGAPPRVGFLSDNGTVVVWRDGAPVVLGRVAGEHRHRALETPVGVYVVTGGGQGHLVTWDGAVRPVPVKLGFQVGRSADGRYLAGVEAHVGRKSWDQLHFLDVTTGEVRSLPKADELTRHVIGIHDGAVYFTTSFAGDAATSCWVAGEEPVALAAPVRWLDPLSGALVRHGAGGTTTLVTASGERTFDLPLGHPVPGGGALYSLRQSALKLLDPTTGATTEHTLPEGCTVGDLPPFAPVWETPETLVFVQPHHRLTRRIVRWHLGRKEFEHYDLPENAGYRPFLIEPILT